MAQMNQELRKYLLSKRWQWKPAGDNDVVVRVCPFCGNSNHKFSINIENTKYQCWVCQATGNLYKLKKHMGDVGSTKVIDAADAKSGELAEQKEYRTISMKLIKKWHGALLRNKQALHYLMTHRGLTMESIVYFKLGFRRRRGIGWITIPSINDGVCRNLKMRTASADPRKKGFERIKGCESVLFNADCLVDHEEVIITEGELDAISLWQIGFKNVVSVPAGAGKLSPNAYDQLLDKQKIKLACDRDVVGQKGARELARRLGFDRTENVVLPLKDANTVLVELGERELKSAIMQAKQFEVDGVLTASDAVRVSVQEQELGEPGIMTPWHKLNGIIKPGFQAGDLVVLTARPKIGKTTMALNISYDLARHHSTPIYFFCLEMRPGRLAKKLAQLIRNKTLEELDLIDHKATILEMKNVPFYFHDPSWKKGSVTPENVFDKIREVVKRYGIRFVVFDHLHFLCRSMRDPLQEQQNVMKEFKLLAEELQIVILLICQPRKSKDKFITSDDLLGSQAIHSDADHILILHRDRLPDADDNDTGDDDERQVLDPKMRIRVDATRFGGGGTAQVYYIGDKSKIVDLEDAPIRKM